jgi:hypothetical protein
MDSISNIRDAIQLFVTKEINNKRYGNKAVTIFDNLDNENSILHNTQDKDEHIIIDDVKNNSDTIIKKNNSGYSKYIKAIMDGPITPIGNITLFNCTTEMLDGIGDEFKRRMGVIIELKEYPYDKK